MDKIDTSGMPDKCSPEFLKKYPDGIPAKVLIDALQEAIDSKIPKTTTASGECDVEGQAL